jgi:hypothetical protein
VRIVVLLVVVAALSLPTTALAGPVPDSVVLAVDRKAGVRNFMPTRMVGGYRYLGWSFRDGVLRMRFRSTVGRVVDWKVAPMTGTCRAGMRKSFQLAGNKVWWAQGGGAQRAWRCVFGADGVPLRLAASSTTPPAKLADVGLGFVVASARRY